MNNKEEPDIIPEQETGKETNTEFTLSALTREEAQKIYKAASNRLLDINNWEKLCGIATADFQLTDKLGTEIKRNAAEGDHFKIDIPGPGSIEGRGFDWVRIEKIEEKIDCDKDFESLSMRVRPAPNPKTSGNEVAHFFNEHATSSFIVERHGSSVKAGVYGRNEKPNTIIKNLVDKARNALIAASALAGISSIQWQHLSKGLLENIPVNKK